MIAYKFLRSGRTGTFSEFQWPEPGVWVQSSGDVAACRSGIHACRTTDLPWWLADELWEIELADEVRADEHKLVAPAGRLLARVDGWTPQCGREYAEACALRARDQTGEALVRAGHAGAARELAGCSTLDELLDASRKLAAEIPDAQISLTILGDGALQALAVASSATAYIAAHAAIRLNGPAAYRAERVWQSRWLCERLGLRADR